MHPAMPAGALSGLLPQELAIGEPDVAGPLTVFPLLAPSDALDYRSFAEAATEGFAVHELLEPSVNDLRAVNPLTVPVLLYEGEEVRGAQQDRTFDVSVLVPPRGEVEVPVSCVERGRWDGSRGAEAFDASPQAAFPALRAAKSRQARAAMAAGQAARADQQQVWAQVEDRGAAASPTHAMRDAFARQEARIDALERAVTRRDGQVGALACLGGRPAVLDLVSRSDVFASLFRPLLRGYCLDALQHEPAPAPDPAPFLASLRGAAHVGRPGVGLGTTLAVTGTGLGGTGLAVDDRLVQLSVFREDRPHGRILRPSRRR
jgi:hypothetical protein